MRWTETFVSPILMYNISRVNVLNGGGGQIHFTALTTMHMLDFFHYTWNKASMHLLLWFTILLYF